MTQEEKDLLFKELCARLPYGVKIHIDLNENGHIVGDATLNTITSITGQIFNFVDFEQDFKNGDCCPISGFGSNKYLHLEEFKPYLRPMSSMTEEELKELTFITGLQYDQLELVDWCNGCKTLEFYLSEIPHYCVIKVFDWLNAHHFDYRGLIEKGLALEAPEGMYETE